LKQYIEGCKKRSHQKPKRAKKQAVVLNILYIGLY
jgi:hypothetical protein